MRTFIWPDESTTTRAQMEGEKLGKIAERIKREKALSLLRLSPVILKVVSLSRARGQMCTGKGQG